MGGMFGGGGGKGGTPTPPNFQNAATMTSLSSRPNWQGPMGGQSWTINPQTGQPTMQVNSAFQPTYNALQGATQSAAGMDPTQARNQAINTNYASQMAMLNPQMQQQTNELNSQLANQGAAPGTMAAQTAQGNLQRGQTYEQQQAAMNAINQGNQTQQTQMQQNMLPFQQLGALQGAQSSSMNVPMGQGANYLNAAGDQYSAQRAQAAQQKGGLGSALGGLAGMAGGPLGSLVGSGIGSLFGGGGGDTSTVGNTPAMFGPGF